MLQPVSRRAMVAMMASQELLAESDPLIEEGPMDTRNRLQIKDGPQFRRAL
jgi:hypothetical protein